MHRLIRAGGSEALAVRGPGHAVHSVTMAAITIGKRQWWQRCIAWEQPSASGGSTHGQPQPGHAHQHGPSSITLPLPGILARSLSGKRLLPRLLAGTGLQEGLLVAA